MRNVVTVIALMVSMTGIFVSLAREELRCKLGLSAQACQPSAEKLKELPQNPINHSDFTKPASQVLNDKPEAVGQGSLEKSNPQPIASPNSDTTPKSEPDSEATKILKPETANTDKSLTPPTESGTSSPENPSPDSTNAESNPPAHESDQMANDDSAASGNDSPSVEHSTDKPGQPIPVIPPLQGN